MKTFYLDYTVQHMSPILLGGCIAVSAAVALMDHQRRVVQDGDPIVMTVEEGTREIMLYSINDLIRDQLEKSNVEMLRVRDSANLRNTQITKSIKDSMTNTINANNNKIQAIPSRYSMSRVYHDPVNRANGVFEDRKRELGKYCHRNDRCKKGGRRRGH